MKTGILMVDESELSLEHFTDFILFSGGPVPSGTTLAVACHWHEYGSAYVTLHRLDAAGGARTSTASAAGNHADFSVRRVFYFDDKKSQYLLLELPPPLSLDSPLKSYYVVRIINPKQVLVLGTADIAKLLPLPVVGDEERCDLQELEALLGPVPTWDEIRSQKL